MSLPTAKPPTPAQLSIRAFFQAQGPKYIPPPPPPPPPSSHTLTAPARFQQSNTDASSANLPPEAGVRPVAEPDLPALRRINALLLPVSYSDSFYQDAVSPATSGRFSRVITWAHQGEPPKVVGGVVCRVESATDGLGHDEPQRQQQQQQHPAHNLYIQSLCLLLPYRGLGLVSAALDHVIATALADPSLCVRTVSAHVWTENDEGLRWYHGRGFRRCEPVIPSYYRRMRPGSAWLVQRHIGASVRSSLPRFTAPASVTSSAYALPASFHSSSSSSFSPFSISLASAAPAISSPPLSGDTTAALLNLTPPYLAPPKHSTSSSTGQSYQTQRPETEWNDLPADMASGLLPPPRRKTGGESASSAGWRSSSSARKKRDRSYPTAAFDN